MKSMVDIDVILDEKYTEPKVTIHTRAKSKQIENIIEAIENASDNDFPVIPGYGDDNVEFLSQRDIVRVYTEARKIVIETDGKTFYTNRTLSGIEDMLNPERFIRISQSEIVNLYKVKRFDVNRAGTIGIEFENGTKSWASRSRVREIKNMLRKYAGEQLP